MENQNNVVQDVQDTQVVDSETILTASEVRCPKCQAALDSDQVFCPECGTPLKKLCQKCGAELQDGQLFCAKCGQKADVASDTAESNTINQFNANITAQQQKNKRLPIIIGGVCAAIAALILLSNAGGGVNLNKQFADIADESWCEIASDGSYMKLDTNPYDIDDSFNSDAYNKIKEVNAVLGFSEALTTKMGETRSMDGRQSDSNDKFNVSWTYHPDQGLEVLYEKK